MDDYSLESLLRPTFTAQTDVLKSFLEKLPAFSPAVTKIVELSSKLNASPGEIVAAIRLDPVLMGRILDLVNSAYFSPAERVSTLSRGVVILGVNTIKNLALSCAVMDAVGGKTKALKELVFPAWKHSLVTAVCAKTVSRLAGEGKERQEEFFVLGLLHFVGRIVIVQAFCDSYPSGKDLSLAEERSLFGTDHCAVGGDLLERWKFSPQIVSAVRDYAFPPGAAKPPCILNLASVMALRWEAQNTGRDPPNAYEEAVIAALSLSESALDGELVTVTETVGKASAFLGHA